MACIAIQSNQNDQHGGQSIADFDYGMAHGVRKTYRKLYWTNLGKMLNLLFDIEDGVEKIKDIGRQIMEESDVYPTIADNNGYRELEFAKLKLLIEEKYIPTLQAKAIKYANEEIDRATYQAMEAFVHNLNTMHSRAGAQVPFSSINFGTDTSPEGRLVIKNIMLSIEAGGSNGETAIFPVSIFKVKESINYNPGDPNYDLFKLAMRVSAKRLFPNFSFVDAPFNLALYREGDPNTEVAYMACRTRVIGNVHDPSRQVVGGRGNLSFTSVNLPRIGIKAHGDIDWFFEELDRKIDLVTNQLMERYKIQAKKRVKNFPFLMGQGVWMDSDELKAEDEIGEVLKHGTLSVASSVWLNA